MKKLVLASAVLMFSLVTASSQATERKLFTAKDATEALMTFDHYVVIQSVDKPTVAEAKEKIEAQLNHLFGPMGFAEHPSVPKGDHVISKVKVKEEARGTYFASYTYKGTILVKNGPETNYKITLPNNPDEIYSAGMVGNRNPCTDEHYQGQGDFWYFWNPNQSGCKLKEGDNYQVLDVKISRIRNMKTSKPEYERLADADGNIVISVLMGMDEPNNEKNPNTSSDTNAANFRDIKKALEDGGFTSKVMKAADIEALLGATVSPKPYVEEFTKADKNANIIVRVSFGPSGIGENSQAFHYLFKDALENSSVMIYDGHSGLGGHLDLASIEELEGFKMKPNKKRYQIYFFNSCSSYTYYNTMFFGRKITDSDPRGTKNLDIMTNGLATYFEVMQPTNMALIWAIDNWADGKGEMSYQALAKEIDSKNLFGINGDEDND